VSGAPSPWGPPAREGRPDPWTDPYAGSYAGPWSRPAPSAPPVPWDGRPGWAPAGPDHVTDDQLRRLPPPPAPAPPVPQRPAVLGLAVTLAVTASLLWVCGLSLFLLVAVAGTRTISPVGEEGYVFHTLDEAVLRMGDGLWVPLYGFPVASLVTGLLLLAGRPWTRLAHTAVGAVALAWAGWWLRESLLAWVVVVLYVGTAVAVLWVPSVGRWYAARPRRPRRPPAATVLNG